MAQVPGNPHFAAFDSTSLCCLSLRGIPAAAACGHLVPSSWKITFVDPYNDN